MSSTYLLGAAFGVVVLVSVFLKMRALVPPAGRATMCTVFPQADERTGR